MLGKRFLTALILGPSAIAAILLLPVAGFAVLVGLLTLLAAWEWADLAGARRPRAVAYVALVLGALVGLWFAVLQAPESPLPLLLLAVAWWLVALGMGMLYPRGGGYWSRPGVLLPGLLVLVPAWLALVHLHGADAEGPRWVLVMMFLIWGADTGAYFAGRAFGRHRLAPAVSPGKTWEGVLGGMALGIALAMGLALLLGLTPPPHFWLLLLVTAAFSVLGDLTESLLKRGAGRKDSGTLFPGHGGVLDRLDSVTAAAPVFVLGLELLG